MRGHATTDVVRSRTSAASVFQPTKETSSIRRDVPDSFAIMLGIASVERDAPTDSRGGPYLARRSYLDTNVAQRVAPLSPAGDVPLSMSCSNKPSLTRGMPRATTPSNCHIRRQPSVRCTLSIEKGRRLDAVFMRGYSLTYLFPSD
jgi:hypothetical protein